MHIPLRCTRNIFPINNIDNLSSSLISLNHSLTHLTRQSTTLLRETKTLHLPKPPKFDYLYNRKRSLSLSLSPSLTHHKNPRNTQKTEEINPHHPTTHHQQYCCCCCVAVQPTITKKTSLSITHRKTVSSLSLVKKNHGEKPKRSDDDEEGLHPHHSFSFSSF